jgi:hypothetical protein
VEVCNLLYYYNLRASFKDALFLWKYKIFYVTSKYIWVEKVEEKGKWENKMRERE